MAKRKKHAAGPTHGDPERRISPQGFYTPFKGLDQHLTRIARPGSPSTGSATVPSSPEETGDAEKLFREAMRDVAPLAAKEKERVPPSSPVKSPPRFLAREELEVYTSLVDLVSGEGQFELTYSDEYVDGAIVGLSPQILKKLRRGEFSYQDFVDLHGLTREEAREVVEGFIRESFVGKLRCILIICGRGLNSKDKQPVLKQNLVNWLIRAPLKRLVLAFASARTYDGGAGALYVLLRRNEKKAPPLITPAR